MQREEKLTDYNLYSRPVEPRPNLWKAAAILAAAAVIAVTLAAGISFTVWIAAAAIFFIALKREIRLYYVLLILIILLLGALGFFNFTLFPQAAIFTYDETKTPLYFFAAGHYHAIRFTVAYPVILITRLTGLNENIAFSLFCQIIIMPGIIISLYSYLKNFIKMNSVYKALIAGIIICLAHFMNGRALFAFLGLSLILYVTGVALIKSALPKPFIFSAKYALICALGITLAAVSSGTVILVCLAFLTGVILLKRRNCRASAPAIIIISAFGVFIALHIGQMIHKNLATYEFNIINMLWHGLGSVLKISLVLLIGGVIAVCAVLPFYYVLAVKTYKFNVLLGYPVVLIPILGACGMFGRTTATMLFLPICISAIFLISVVAAKLKGRHEKQPASAKI